MWMDMGITNIFFTLAIGVLGIWVVERLWAWSESYKKFSRADVAVHVVLCTLLLGLFCVAAMFLRVDYGAGGVTLIFMFYGILKAHKYLKWRRAFKEIFRILSVTAAVALFSWVVVAMSGFSLQWWGMLSVLFIWVFADKKIRTHWWEKYFFYVYYPAHFLILYLIAVL